jgi:hypothetical protein
MNLTAEEKGYLRRMVYETVHGLFGPGTIFETTLSPDHDVYKDLVELATPEIQRERDWWDSEEVFVPPEVPFPWDTPQELHEKVVQMQQVRKSRH